MNRRELGREDYKDSYYEDLKAGNIRVKFAESRYRCPFCEDRRDDYNWRDLLDHASRAANQEHRTWRDRGRHSALVRFIDRNISVTDHRRSRDLSVDREDDYKSGSVVSRVKRSSPIRNSDLSLRLKVPKTDKLDSGVLTDHTKAKQLEAITEKYDQTSLTLKTAMDEKDKMMKKFNEEILKTEQKSREYMDRVISDHRRAASELEARKQGLRQREQQIMQNQAQNQSERQKIQNEMKRVFNELNIKVTAKSQLGVKRMGDIDGKPFFRALKNILECLTIFGNAFWDHFPLVYSLYDDESISETFKQFNLKTRNYLHQELLLLLELHHCG
ncbi:hypothetical protein ACFE04_013655 [Oxalis oulophora]